MQKQGEGKFNQTAYNNQILGVQKIANKLMADIICCNQKNHHQESWRRERARKKSNFMYIIMMF